MARYRKKGCRRVVATQTEEGEHFPGLPEGRAEAGRCGRKPRGLVGLEAGRVLGA